MAETFDIAWCENLATPRQRQICRGETDIPRRTVEKYLRKWQSDNPSDRVAQFATTIDLTGDVFAQILQRHPARLDPGYGPGTELRDMLAELWLTPRDGCGCQTRLKVMNGWGVEGCRYNRDKIVGWLREAAAKTTRWLRMRAVLRAVWVGLVWELPWRDPYGGLVDLAIYRAERQIASDKR